MDGDMVVPMQQAAEAAGVKVALNQMVQSFRADGGSDSIMVQTSTGNEHQGDIVILGMGVKPRTELAQSANLK
jgi:NAD(P)H-nitrite reductase large subunit